MLGRGEIDADLATSLGREFRQWHAQHVISEARRLERAAGLRGFSNPKPAKQL